MSSSDTPRGASKLDEIASSIKRLKSKGTRPPVRTYKVSIMGPSLEKHHIQTVQAESPGAALDMVLRASGASDCTQYGVLLVATNTTKEVA